MTSMNLLYVDKYGGMLMITEAEVKRLAAAAANGEELVYESEKGCLMLNGGTLTVSSFESVPALFTVEYSSLYNSCTVDMNSEKSQPLKALIKKVVVSEGTKYLKSSFIGFSELTEVSLPDSIEYMECPFADCKKLKPYPLPKSLRSIRGSIYGEFPDEVILPEGLTSISSDGYPPYYNDTYCFAGSPIRAITLPSTLDSFSGAFKRCRNLKSLTLSEGISKIGNEVFCNCINLDNVVIPKSVSYIGEYAFSDCSSLGSVILNSDPEISETAFLNTPFEPVAQMLRLINASHTEYSEEMGEIPEWERLHSTLCGMPLTEQVKHFSIKTSSDISCFSYGKEDSSENNEGGFKPFPSDEVESFILKNEVIVGAMVDSVAVIAGRNTLTYSASEDDGTGSRSREDYCLIKFGE